MGQILHDLVRIKLPDREPHNSRMFIDLCENIHIHYREFRIVFSLDEYFEFADILARSTEDVRNYLAQNPDYVEHDYKTTVMVAGGFERQRKLLQNSPQPNKSYYFANDFAIELQAESVIDEIHVHWRDYRFAMNREQFRLIANAFTNAHKELTDFESKNVYERKAHRDREIRFFEEEKEAYKHYDTRITDETILPLSDVFTRFKNIEKEFCPENKSIQILKKLYGNNSYVFPILLSTEKDGSHYIIDGNHRYFAALKAECKNINCIITDLTFEDSDDFRAAESLLKKFDQKTGYKYNVSAFNREFIAYKTGKYYRNHFYKLVNPNFKTKVNKNIKRIKTQVFDNGKKYPGIYKTLKKIYHLLNKKPRKR